MKKIAAFALFCITIPFVTFAQSVTTETLSANSFCDSATVNVNYNASGTFGAKNVFTVQLSDANGSFVDFTNIGSVKSTTSGSITAALDCPSGSHYRLRVTASNPYVIGNDNGSDITVSAMPQVRCNFDANYWAFLVGDSLRFFPENAAFYQSVDLSGCSFSWNFGDGANPATSTDSAAFVTYNTTGTKTIMLTTTSLTGCSGSNSDSVTHVQIYDCFPAIPNDAFIDSVDASTDNGTLFRGTQDIWVVPGGILNGSVYYGRTIFVEAGGSVLNPDGGGVIYLKDGATVSGGVGTVIIHSPGAGLSNDQWTDQLTCSSLGFNYTNAPTYKIIPAPAGVISGVQSNPGFSIYPNPATNLVNIESNEIPQSISVRNELGEEILSDNGPLLTSKIEFDMSRFADGVYYVDLGLNGKMETLKFSIAR